MIQKHKDSRNSLWDNFKNSNIHVRGVPEGEEKDQVIGNLSEKIVKENFPNLVKEIDMPIPGSMESPNYDGYKEAHAKTHYD